MQHDSPKRYIATASNASRKGVIFIDYLRNDLTSTAVAPFSVRAKGRPLPRRLRGRN
jgi:bifunctional non-homologous end joining protein LigD